MIVKVKLFATLRSYGPTGIKLGESFPITLEEDAVVAVLLDKLKIPKKEAKLIMINGNNSELGDKLIEGDTIAIFPPIGGG
ncbi:MAG: MoaD/ThiS family protein [Candidatus Heimdallarchaeota archaeon]|nr:MAG: MoaD/ThiS family protein [Candidatus Heimdallarchaeota archaeon]